MATPEQIDDTPAPAVVTGVMERPRRGWSAVNRWLDDNTWLPVLVVVAGGLVARILLALSTTLNPDEAMHVLRSCEPTMLAVYRQDLAGPDPSFLHVLLFPLCKLYASDFVLRLPSIIAGTLTIFFGYKWLEELFDRTAGLIGAILLAFAPAVIFLSADAFGVLPPVSRLTEDQTKYYFLSGYTAKIAGTERGIVEPVPHFSTCFGATFLMLDPIIYANELARKMKIHKTEAWLVNTGWMGGTYNSGTRIDLRTTRRIINAILYDEMENSDFSNIPVFNLSVPSKIEGVGENILDPSMLWDTPRKWHIAAADLAMKFILNFNKFAPNEETARLTDSGPRI